ncbi:phosphate-starvation-inducible PsiE family protein [Acidicapsa acidisoli]|uniref:phosphate-starvation-inducible PsiE family protein n=1 Tax=Acidicapsa acidisoli TaxID=1615681 RepID=UPI0021DFBEC7|nr:phosphate-starvation-inducible PsiE family protein [Acidicapsa acidisoli]
MSITERLHSFEARMRVGYCQYLSLVEVLIYILLGTLLAVTAALGVAGAFSLVAGAIRNWNRTEDIFELIDRLLLVLMLLEILHTLRISIRSRALVVEPFLVVGLIASIRRILVLGMQAEALTKKENWDNSGKPLFEASMIEFGVLALVITVLVGAIYFLRKSSHMSNHAEHDVEARPGIC